MSKDEVSYSLGDEDLYAYIKARDERRKRRWMIAGIITAALGFGSAVGLVWYADGAEQRRLEREQEDFSRRLSHTVVCMVSGTSADDEEC